MSEQNVKKRILITSTDVMMLQFLIPHIFELQKSGYYVEAVCSNVENHVDELQDILRDKVKLTVVDLCRNPFSLSNTKGFRQMKRLVSEGNFDLIWTNEPVMGVITRLAARKSRKNGCKVLYIAHGFHFYKGAPRINWLIYYPIERLFAKITDCLITINEEDYTRAKKKFNVRHILKFPGIGVDVSKFKNPEVDKNKKCAELNISPDSFIYLSVGELEKRKNHATTIAAFKKAEREMGDSVLLICGVGSQKESLEALIKSEKLENKVFLLGYRYDISELLSVADAFVFTTFQEGLSVALMEAMSNGAACMVSEIRGNIDLMDKGKCVFCDPHSVDSCSVGLIAVRDLQKKQFKEYNQEKIKEFDIENVKMMMKSTVDMLMAETGN